MNKQNDENLAEKMFPPPKKITKVGRYKKRLDSQSETWEYREIFRGAHSIRRPIFWLIDSESKEYLWQFIAESRRAIDGDVASFIQRQQAFLDAQQIVMMASSPELPRTDGKIGGIEEVTGIRGTHMREIAFVRKNYKPLKAQDIAEKHIELFGKLLQIEQSWAADLFLFEIPGAYVGAGKIAVKQFIETLGQIIKLFRDQKTEPDKIDGEFTRLEGAKDLISQIAREEF